MRIPAGAVEAIRSAGSIGVLTGAGVSAESGIATFRDAQTGLWSKFRPEQLATPQAFEQDPTLVWEWYAWRRQQVMEAAPNPAHHTLAALTKTLPVHLITQNVDGLHQRAGAETVIELHGSIMSTLCHRTRQPVDEAWLEQQAATPPPSPHHPQGLCRPGVVWFGEALPASALERAFEVAEQSNVFMSIGTSTVVEPAASLPLAAKRSGAYLIEINPAETPLTHHCDLTLPGPAGRVLPALAQALQSV